MRAGERNGRGLLITVEGIDGTRLVTPAELTAMLANGEITDSFLLAAYAFATARGLFAADPA